MMRKPSGRARVLGLVLVVLVAAGMIALVAQASTYCKDKQQGCKYTVSLSEYTGSPTVPCLIGHPVVQVTLSATCQGTYENDTQLRCGVLADPVEITAGNKTVSVQPISGETWESALNGPCSLLDVSVN